MAVLSVARMVDLLGHFWADLMVASMAAMLVEMRVYEWVDQLAYWKEQQLAEQMDLKLEATMDASMVATRAGMLAYGLGLLMDWVVADSKVAV